MWGQDYSVEWGRGQWKKIHGTPSGTLETGKGVVGEGRAETAVLGAAVKIHNCIYILPDLLIFPEPAGSRGLPRNR